MTTIRPATEQDAPHVHRLIELLEAPRTYEFDAFSSKFRSNLVNPLIVYLVAEADGAVCSFGSLQFSSPLHHIGPVAEIVELVVEESCRGAGIGAAMVEEMAARARERGCECLELSTNRMRERAHRFYERQGFRFTHLRFTMALTDG